MPSSLRITRPVATVGELRAFLAEIDRAGIDDGAALHAKTRVSFSAVGPPLRELIAVHEDPAKA